MRIRKTFQGQLPDNKILNNTSNSETDTYSCKYINESLVFEEQDPTVPEHVKNISEEDIKKWNSGTGGGSGDIPDIDVTDFNTNWVNAELTADFKLYNDASYCRYAKVGNLVNIQFVLSPASADNVLNSYTETTAFVLPEEYRPSQNLNVLCQGSDMNVFSVGINTAGNVYLQRYRSGNSLSSTPPGTSAWLPCNITYMIDNGALIVSSANAGGLSVNQVYPVGSVFISTVDQNPGNIFLGTSWERFATGRTLVGVDTSDEDFATTEQVGGEKTHLLTAAQSGLPVHKHTQAAHSHNIGRDKDGGSGTNRYTVHGAGASGADDTSPTSSATPAINNSTAQDATEAHNNLQPYITVFMWKRIA